jgi:hypothetical protein
MVPAGWTWPCLHTTAFVVNPQPLCKPTRSEVAVTAIPIFVLIPKPYVKKAVFLFDLGCGRGAMSFAVLSPIERHCILPACTILKLRSHRTFAGADESQRRTCEDFEKRGRSWKRG